MNKLKDFLKKYTSKQVIQIAGIVFVVLLSITAIAAPSLLKRQKNLSIQNSKASEITAPPLCDVQFIVSQPTPTLTSTPSPTISPTPTNTPTPSLTPTLTPTPTLSCKNLDIAIVVDRSGTMTDPYNGQKKLLWAKQAMTLFVQKLRDSIPTTSASTVRVAVASFGRRGNVDLPYDPVLMYDKLSYPPPTSQVPDPNDYNSTLNGSLSSDFDQVLSNISSVNYNLPGTCIQCGLYIGNNELLENSLSNRKVVILLSDGIANKIWNGDNPNSSICNKAAIDQAKIGRTNNIEYRVIGYGDKLNPTPQIFEPNLKAIACADPNDAVCVNKNYTYAPNPTDWANGFLNILNSLCQ